MSNPITVELPADLPTDWQQYQVVSPNGTEAGLDEQHGYNYLMEQVNNAQTAAKECGEALGDTVPASREINGHPLTDDVTLDAADVGAANRNFLQETVFGLGSTSYNGWLEIGRTPINSTYRSLRVVFLVIGSNGTGSGVLSLAIRVGSTAGSLENSETTNNLKWLTLDRADLADKFAIAQEDGYAVLYFQIDGAWRLYHIGILGQAFGSEPFTDPASSDLFKLSDNYNLEGNHKDSITPFRTSSIGFTPEIMGAAAASGWVNGRLFVGGSSGGITQLGYPSSAGSVLRCGTSGAPYWTNLTDFRSAMGLSNAAKIETGHYIGTGNSGSSATANQITFGFKPKLVIIQRRNIASAIIFVTETLLENNYKLNGWVPINIDAVGADCFACKIGSSVKWYYSGSDSSDTDNKQFNVVNEVYYYVGIG